MDDISFWLVAFTVVLFICYAGLLGYYRRGWHRLKEYAPPQDVTPAEKVSVIVPARDEEKHIGPCVQSLLAQQYPAHLLQVIVIDDHSTDNTAAIVEAFNDERILLIRLQDHVQGAINSYKKKAIATAIAQATGDWIITTDADCIAPPQWVSTIMAYRRQTGALMVAAPVKLDAKQGLLHVFQSLDFLTLQGITAASVSQNFHSMANGANLCYSKQAFIEVSGFEGIDHVASGDDMLLMYKIVTRHPGRMAYLKSRQAIVTTAPAGSWKAFWQQRIRWASKADKYDDRRIFWALLLVYLLNFFLVALFIVSIFNFDLLIVATVLLLAKALLEYPFVSSVAAFFHQERLMRYFLLLQPLHAGYTVIAGWLGKFGRYEWKGRTVK